MAYEMIVLDLDGTLTNSQKVITPKTKQALMKIQEEGIKVVLASGRPTAGILNLSKELCLDKYEGYILSFNGARIIDVKTKEVIYNKVLPKEMIPDIFDEVKKLKVGILTYEENEIIIGNGMDKYNQLESKVNGIPTREVDDFASYITFPVNKCLLTGHPKKILYAEDVLKEKFGEYLNIYKSEPFFLEIMPKNIDKAYSLSKLLDHIGITRKQMICCGDGYNDLTMIRFAGLGVAMKNAQEDVKREADFITYSNDEDGIAYVIEKFIEKESEYGF
ncbi:MAG: Cof-type HAD-IIB family hydrolase [Velocimicrobium sp.]